MIHNLGTKTTLGSLLPTLSRTANANGTGFDLQGSNDAEGDAVVILDCGAATAGTAPYLQRQTARLGGQLCVYRRYRRDF
jgi:hypothetical protein